MVNRSFKDNYVTLVMLFHYSYYFTCRIARQFGDRQGAPSDDGSFHTLALTERILGKLCETCSWRMTAKDIHFP